MAKSTGPFVGKDLFFTVEDVKFQGLFKLIQNVIIIWFASVAARACSHGTRVRPEPGTNIVIVDTRV